MVHCPLHERTYIDLERHAAAHSRAVSARVYLGRRIPLRPPLTRPLDYRSYPALSHTPDCVSANDDRYGRLTEHGRGIDRSRLDTVVGERGARLSLGQRQPVALARVLLQDPAVLLLDEATASIDPFTEAQVQAGLASVLRGRTSVVIAHRLSTVRTADRIIVMRQGQIIEAGDHDRLLEQGGHYAELYTTYFRHQAEAYQPWEEQTTS